MNLSIVWEEKTGPQGPFDGCDLMIYEAGDPRGCPIHAVHYRRQIAQIPAHQRKVLEARAVAESRRFIASVEQSNEVTP